MKSESDEQRKANPSGMCKGSKEKEKGTETENTPLLTKMSKTSQKIWKLLNHGHHRNHILNTVLGHPIKKKKNIKHASVAQLATDLHI